MKNTAKLPFAWLLGVGIAHALFLVWLGVQILPDTVSYVSAAQDFAGFIYSSHTIRTPGYPFFMLLLWNDVPMILTVQHIMVVLVACMAFRMMQPYDKGSAAVVFWVIGLNPWFAYWASALMTETLALFLVFASLYFLVKRSPFSSAILLGLAILVRPSSVGVLPAFVLGVWWMSRAARKTVLATLLCFTVISPWLVRNRVLMGSWTISSVAGHTLWSRQAPLTSDPAGVWKVINRVLVEKGEIEGDSYFMRLALQTAYEHPWGTVTQFLRSAKAYLAYDIQFLDPHLGPEWSNSLMNNTGWILVMKIVFQFLLPMLVWGMAWMGSRHLLKHRRYRITMLYGAGLSAVILLIGIGDTRLRLPAEPMLMMFASMGLCMAWRTIKALEFRPRSIALQRPFQLPPRKQPASAHSAPSGTKSFAA